MEAIAVYTKSALVNNIINPRLRLKYRLKEMFVALVGQESQIKKAKEYVYRTYGIPTDTISYHMNILAGSTHRVPDETLAVYAAFLGVPVDSLKTNVNF